MARATKPKGKPKPKPSKARPAAHLTPLEAWRLAERYQGNEAVALWLKSVPIRNDSA